MAEDPEIRALMKRMNADYLHIRELAGLFCRELLLAPSEDVWALFMRSLPDVSAVKLDVSEPPSAPGHVQAAAVTFRREEFPMIDLVSRADLTVGELDAERIFSQERDLWITDHKPFKFLRHPLVSAIMAVETFFEACRILYPYLKVKGLRNAQFLDIIECAPGTQRPASILCRTVESAAEEILCEVSLVGRDAAKSRPVDRRHANYRGVVVLAGGNESDSLDLDGFPVALDELDSRPMDHAEALEWYEKRTDLVGRYRVIDTLDGTSATAISGTIRYQEKGDFAGRTENRYQYSPYLLEALMQMVNFYIVMRNADEERSMIPYGIGELMFSGKCTKGQTVRMEARLRTQTNEGLTWDARGIDENGRVLMVARNVMMRWFS
jgi:hypothetical protein